MNPMLSQSESTALIVKDVKTGEVLKHVVVSNDKLDATEGELKTFAGTFVNQGRDVQVFRLQRV